MPKNLSNSFSNSSSPDVAFADKTHKTLNPSLESQYNGHPWTQTYL